MAKTYRPSRLLRWPLYMLNGLLLFVTAGLAGSVALFRALEQEPPWALIFVGGGVSLVFVALNSAITGMRLGLDEEGLSLRVWFWRRRISWPGAVVEKETRAVGLVAVRIRSEGSAKGVYLNPAWFADFDDAVREIEARVSAAGGSIREAPSA